MSKSELKRLCAQNQSIFDVLLRCLPESPYRDRFTSAIKKLEDMAKQQKETIDELEQRVKVLTDALTRIQNEDIRLSKCVAIAYKALAQTPQQTAEQIERWHVEWMKTLPVAGVIEQSNFGNPQQVHLVAIPQLPETKESTK